MLDDLDRELWERGHRFVRYADDLRVFVRSERAAQRVFESVCGVIERRLKLKVNRGKSSIRHAAQATLLGFGFFFDGPQVGIRIAPKAIARLKNQLRMLTRRRWSVSMDYRIGRLNPVHHRLGGLLPARPARQRARQAGRMAAPPPAAGPLERMEDHRRQAAQPANTRHLRKRGPEMGRCQQEILAGCRLPDPPGIPAQLLLGPPWPEDPDPDLAASQPNGLTNRRMRTRMSGGVRGGGATPPPTRFNLQIRELGKSRSICVGVRACALRPLLRRMRSAR